MNIYLLSKLTVIINSTLDKDNCNLTLDKNVIMFSHFNSDLTKILCTVSVFPLMDSEDVIEKGLNEIEEYLNNSENFK